MTSPADRAWPGKKPWVEDDDTEAVRPYAVTGGRTSPSVPLELMTLVRATGSIPDSHLDPEQIQTVRLCRHEPCTVAEVAAKLQRPVQVAKIVISDLIGLGAVVPRAAVAVDPLSALPRTGLLEKLLDGLEKL